VSPAPLLEFRDLTFARNDVPLFAGLSGAVRGGDLLQILGANGAGKTTLLRVLATMLSPAAGSLCWRGRPLPRERTRYLAELACIGHSPGLKRALSPRENLRWLGGLFPLRRELVDATLARFGLSEWADVPCAQLSAGQVRRVALARLPLSGAALWILDEPLTAIDREGTALIEELLQRHQAAGGAVVFSSHQPLALPGVRQLALAE
jgi:heme exporter protein A